ncbi:MAG TPA: YciI family protein [Balneolales bacterium]|nr:YciI family protein [Balneolales bacterium]
MKTMFHSKLNGDSIMRFMMFMIPPEYQPDASAAKKADKNFAPPKEAVAEMMKYNEDLAKADVLISLEGLHPLAKGARVAFKDGETSVTDGPFVEAKEVIGGYWLIDVKSKEEAIEWAKRCPAVNADSGAVIEVRQVFETSEFPEDVQKAAQSDIVSEQLKKNR